MNRNQINAAARHDIDDDEALATAVAVARAQLAAGESVAGEEVLAWIESWGSAEVLPVPGKQP